MRERPRPGDKERKGWIEPPKDPVRLTLSELEIMFTEDASFYIINSIIKEEKYIIYVQQSKKHSSSDRKVAYGCGHCGKILLGEPLIKDENSIGRTSKSGRRGYKVSCRSCGVELYERTSELS